MFVTEARFSARLNHANIVQTTAIVQRAGMPAIVMEYLEGQSLATLLGGTRGTIPLELHLRILVDALRGLHYAHELTDLEGRPLRVVHRDVSPQNIFVSYDGQVKLIDFGIAKLAGAGQETATGVIKGKVRYMPPEQIRGRPSIEGSICTRRGSSSGRPRRARRCGRGRPRSPSCTTCSTTRSRIRAR